jgi:hypothetical protein
MKKNAILILLGVSYLFFSYSCKKVDNNQYQNKTIGIKNCNSISQVQFPVICFDSLITESRCPKGVACPFIGFAAVKLSIKNGAGLMQSFSLSTLSGAYSPNDTTINGYNIKLVNVFPYPDVLALPNPDSYKVEVQITY